MKHFVESGISRKAKTKVDIQEMCSKDGDILFSCNLFQSKNRTPQF